MIIASTRVRFNLTKIILLIYITTDGRTHIMDTDILNILYTGMNSTLTSSCALSLDFVVKKLKVNCKKKSERKVGSMRNVKQSKMCKGKTKSINKWKIVKIC